MSRSGSKPTKQERVFAEGCSDPGSQDENSGISFATLARVRPGSRAAGAGLRPIADRIFVPGRVFDDPFRDRSGMAPRVNPLCILKSSAYGVYSKGLQSLYSWVRFPPAPPTPSPVLSLYCTDSK